MKSEARPFLLLFQLFRRVKIYSSSSGSLFHCSFIPYSFLYNPRTIPRSPFSFFEVRCFKESIGLFELMGSLERYQDHALDSTK
ncbi:hypothetical protein CEXT_32991 [Caerostris extrusa]|uniref:Uncharacterized protein n=1 Tax=Caerostris extrusa TaxID=172846 RepID=A0AAV4VX88_CAEEX|nr:hypothetical protein CEXT_32991 [Caerostris extrusa]